MTTATARISAGDLKAQIAAGQQFRLLDVRTPGEYQEAHIAGSLNVPLDRLHLEETALASLRNGPVVIVCRSGARAQQAQRQLAAAGFAGLSVLDGGILAWEKAGGAVERAPRRRWFGF